ncbi:ribose-phosphate diphosphokinase [Thauera sinica]|uniref:Ribose-phosphate diphosphokinase n=1 Tax=Thauera sinica TaxID=2665146 RepID=A0ABW1ASU7_9RHOO|nr:ribose-phosphate diphosphokinase [Thauera sp. K11]ATE61115.1 phosphoribosylpyrophosphate synthetase [Thauera sp. K11]
MGAALLFFDDERGAAARLAQAAGLEPACIERHRFPDDELRLRLPVGADGRLPPRVVLFRSLARPNEKLVELLLAARTARTLGARQLVLVAPYLAYMRQDAAFRPGEAVSQRVVGDFLGSLFDALVTLDPHLHRVAALSEAVPLPHAVALSAAPLLADLIAARCTAPVLIGPDAESAQWVGAAAARHGFDHAVCTKHRHGDHEVDIELPPRDVRGRAVVLLDDVASSGRTLARAALLLRRAGAASVDVAVTHALFAGDALQAILAAGVGRVWSTDCIAHPTNAVGVAPLLAAALRELPGPAA